MFTKSCPTCGIEMSYKTNKSLSASIRKNSVCEICRRLKISSSHKGVIKSDIHRKKLSEAKIGCKLSKKHRLNISKSNSGKIRSEESKNRYSVSKMGNKNPTKQDWVKNKIRNSIIKLYEENPEIKDRISNSLYRYFQNNTNYTSIENQIEYQEYRKIVNNLTNRNKKELLSIWDGIDYYDGEFILDNYSYNYNDERYPTIDHKISILYGFKNNIDAEIISSIENLCITKRTLNSKKGYHNYTEFFEKIKLLSC